VIHRLGIFLGCCLALWVVLFLPAWLLWPEHRETHLICSLTAAFLCILPTLLAMAWAFWGVKQNPQQQLLAVLGSTGIRMFFVLGFGLLLANTIQLFIDYPKSFWFWILVFYLATLALEVAVVVLAQQKQLTLAVKKTDELAGEVSRN
jgi:hypothetical protein